jgi:multiple sugar transport system permease protein
VGRATAPAWRRRLWPAGLPALLAAPALLVVFLVIGIPLVYSLTLSLHRINPLTQRWIFVGFGNYAQILPDPDFLAAFGRTAYFAVVTVLGGLALGMAMALVLNMSFVGRNILRSLVLVPWAMSPVAVGILWSWMLNGEYGTFNAVLLSLGVIHEPIHWLGNGTLAFNFVALAHVWNQAPLTSLLLLAGLQSMPENLHRAARIDGAGPMRRFFSITLPWLRPMLLLVMILTSINSIMAFDLFWTMTHGGPGSATTVFSWMGYAYAFQFFRFGEGAAILYVLTIVCLILAWCYLKLFLPAAPRSHRRTSRTAKTALSETSLAVGPALSPRLMPVLTKLPAFEARRWLSGRPRRIAAVVGLALAALLIFVWSFAPFFFLVLMSLSPSSELVRSPPILVPNSLTLENYAYILAPQGVSGGQSAVEATRVVSSIWNSLIVAACVTLINLVLGSFAGYAFSRSPNNRFLSGSLWALMMTRMTPSLALILPFFIVFKTLALIDTRTALVIAYCSLILPLSTWMMKSYFDGMPPNIERAGLVDGCTRLQMIRKIVLPLARPGLVAAGIFCFLVSWNEFIFALILTSTPQAKTIPVIIAGFLVQLRFYDYGPMFAASVMAVLPPVVLTLAFQRYLVRGMLSGSLKG